MDYFSIQVRIRNDLSTSRANSCGLAHLSEKGRDSPREGAKRPFPPESFYDIYHWGQRKRSIFLKIEVFLPYFPPLARFRNLIFGDGGFTLQWKKTGFTWDWMSAQ
jgi:hypothetical protein